MRSNVVFCAIVLAGCSTTLGAAEGDFKRGRLPEAEDKLVALEPRLPSWDEPQRVEYALYRGLVLHALGDRAQAVVWLRQAKDHAGLLRDDDRTRLQLALDAIGKAE